MCGTVGIFLVIHQRIRGWEGKIKVDSYICSTLDCVCGGHKGFNGICREVNDVLLKKFETLMSRKNRSAELGHINRS